MLGLFSNSRAQSGGRISGFDHVAVPMRNEQSMIEFYRSLGFIVNEGTRICSVHFGEHKINFHRETLWGDAKFELRAAAAEPPCGDFCFVWNGSAAELVAMLGGARADVIEGPVQRQGGRDGGSAKGTSRYIRDPDGNLLEFIIY
jgi:catechol 2,3-dioxygenase-like lactoylglutathione lyase family enzyme